MTTPGLKDWLLAYAQGSIRLTEILEKLTARGAVSTAIYHAEIALLDEAVSRQQIDEKLHRAFTAKLTSLHDPLIGKEEQQDDGWAQSTAAFAAQQPEPDEDADDKTQLRGYSAATPALPPAVPPPPAEAPVAADEDDEKTVFTKSATPASPVVMSPTAEALDATQFVKPRNDAASAVPAGPANLPGSSTGDDSQVDLTNVDFSLDDQDDAATQLDTESSRSRSSLSESALRRVAETQIFMAPGGSIGLGSTVQGRFYLEKEIGRGGMGVVYRARDENMVRARDKDPFVALKVLNDELRRHPEALVILQREARRARQLAHPNIVTVYDFHIDGLTVFMTMEYVTGSDLRTFIRSQAKAGLPLSQARPIIEGMALALGYAHQQGVVHSDFKPGNVMMTAGGIPKIFDFGIARAGRTAPVPGEVEPEEREVTQFDAATLGALTPAYASLEMIEGADPEPNDDIYALGCITYELLTGRHPFGKKSAEESLKEGLKATRPVGLTNTQWKTLSAAIAFRRKDRLKSAAQLAEGMRPLSFKERALPIAAFAIPSLLALIAIIWVGTTQLHKKRIRDVVGALQEKRFENADQALQKLGGFDEADRNEVLLGPDTYRAAVRSFVESTVTQSWNTKQNVFDYPAAKSVLDRFGKLYAEEPAWLAERRRQLDDEKRRVVSDLDEALSNQLSAKADPVFITTLETLRRIEPDVSRGGDQRVEGAFLALIDSQPRSNTAELARAKEMIDLARGFVPQSAAINQRLEDLKGLSASLDVADRAKQDFEMQLKHIDELVAAPRDAQDWRLELAEALRKARKQALDSGDPKTAAAYESRQTAAVALLVNQAAATLETAQKGNNAAGFEATQTAAVLVQEFDGQNKRAVEMAKAAVDGLKRLNAERDQTAGAADRARRDFQTLLASARQDGAWSAQLATQFKGLQQALGNDPFIAEARSTALVKLDGALGKQLDERFYPGAEALAQSIAQFDAAAGGKAGERIALAKRQRVEELLAAKVFDVRWQQQFKEAYGRIAADNSPASAALKTRVADFFLQSAERLETSKQYADALNLLTTGVEQLAGDAAKVAKLKTLKESILAKSQADGLSARVAGLKSDIQRQADNQSPKVVARKLVELKAIAPEDEFLRGEGSRLLAVAALKLLSADPKTALAPETAGFVAEYRRADASGYQKLASSLDAPMTLGLTRLAASRDASRMTDVVAAIEKLGITLRPELKKQLTTAVAAPVQPAAAGAKPPVAGAAVVVPPPAAANTAPTATVPTTPEVKPAVEAPKTTVAVTEEPKTKPATPPVVAPVEPVDNTPKTPDSCAKEGLANGGANARRRCSDDLSSGGKGPDLVVIEAGGKKFAISKYEVRVADYNRYCEKAGCARKDGDGQLPVVNVSMAEISAYTQWLGRETGRKFQLPTAEQWRLAARPESAASMKDLNCVRRGASNEIEMGATLLPVNSGSPNPLGLFNVFGNAAELVSVGGGAALRGGSHSDSMERCVNQTGTENGSTAASPDVGFRIARPVDSQ